MVKVAFVIGEYPPEQRLIRENAAKAFASPEVEVGIIGAKASPYASITPGHLPLVSPAYIEAFREAERQGYDAVVPLGTLDIAVNGGRSCVDIPVIGPMEAMMYIALMLGGRFGVLVYHDDQLAVGRQVVDHYGMLGKVAGWRSCNVHLHKVADNKQAQIDAAVAGGRELVKEGADVILPMGITLCPVNVSAAWLSEQVGVPVVEGIGAPIRMAALLAGLGLRHSRKYWPKTPAEVR